jgi:hypothetical protein
MGQDSNRELAARVARAFDLEATSPLR